MPNSRIPITKMSFDDRALFNKILAATTHGEIAKIPNEPSFKKVAFRAVRQAQAIMEEVKIQIDEEIEELGPPPEVTFDAPTPDDPEGPEPINVTSRVTEDLPPAL